MTGAGELRTRDGHVGAGRIRTGRLDVRHVERLRKIPVSEGLRSSWSASRPSSALMPPATRPVLLWYDTPGSVRLVQRSGQRRAGQSADPARRRRVERRAEHDRRHLRCGCDSPRPVTSSRPRRLQLRLRPPPRWQAISRSSLSLRFGPDHRCHSAGHRLVCSDPIPGVSYRLLSYIKASCEHAWQVTAASRRGFATRRHRAAVARIRRNVLPR